MTTKTDSAGDDRLDELAEDMLDLLTKVQNIASAQTTTTAKIDQLARAQAVEVDALRRDLLGERKAFTARSVFNTLLASIESLRAMMSGLDPELDSRTTAQLSAVISSLSTVVQGLGFLEFQVSVGDAFDPGRMEVVGFADGEHGQVLKVGRPGYSAGDVVVRPCGVYLANPAGEPSEGKA